LTTNVPSSWRIASFAPDDALILPHRATPAGSNFGNHSTRPPTSSTSCPRASNPETKKDALAAFDAFVETWGVKYDKAVACLIKDRDALLAFYNFPAEHWKHLRKTNVIESSFATVRHRTVRSNTNLVQIASPIRADMIFGKDR
jgi:hypothetical protein